MKNKFITIFQVAVVFVGTVVGAGLASGQEISQFFTTYGLKGFIGIVLCPIIYIFVGYMIVELSISYKLKSYNQLINLVSPGILGKATDWITGLFLLSSAAIILAGSGALLHQFFGISRWVGIIIMASISLMTLLRNTQGLIEINSFIVPSLVTLIVTLFVLYYFFGTTGDVLLNLNKSYNYKTHWFISTLLYGGFNILCCSGVLVPFSSEMGEKKLVFKGIILGSVILAVLSFMINFMLMLNIPYIFNYEIPLLYIANRFGRGLQFCLLIIILCEMFSTEVSDIYSIAKTLEQKFKISYNSGVIIVILLSLPISQIGFVKLINVLYPSFGIISLFFIFQCSSFFYFKHKKI